MKFDPTRNKGYLSFEDFISCNGALIDKETTEKEIFGDFEWREYAYKLYMALPELDVNYDSTADTLAHIRRVSILLNQAAVVLLERANHHDDSKFDSTEKYHFDQQTPNLKKLTYGSEEYKNSLKLLGVALRHHYVHNRHHPEHFENGVNGMNLLDVLEMLLDWKAATERHEDGDIKKSLEVNKDRFGLSDQLYQILKNTIDYLNLA